MKNLKRTSLTLRKEQIRTLERADLAHVAGGDPASALCPTRRFCLEDSRRMPPYE